MHEVVCGLLINNGRALLCHRRPDRQWYPNAWDLPGGHVEDGEHHDGAIARELREELGITVVAPIDSPLVVLRDLRDASVTIYRIGSWKGDPVNAAPEEHDDLGWFHPHEIHDLSLAFPALADILGGALLEASADGASHRKVRPL